MISTVPEDNCYEFRGLSTDTKPIERVGNGSIFFEIDTSKVFCFNKESNAWVEI